MLSKLSFTTALLFSSACTLAATNPGRGTTLENLPHEAQTVISAALGVDLNKYHPRATHNGYEVENPKQLTKTYLSASGIDTRISGHDWKIDLLGYGYGRAMTMAPKVIPVANNNRIEYRRGLLTEWYVNGHRGLEQGFTLSRQPKGSAKGRILQIAMGFSGDFQVLEEDNRSLRLTVANGDSVLRYGGLSVRDANDKELAATLRVSRNHLWLEIDDSTARYPIMIDPTIENFKLTASDGTDGDKFGISVAIDGNTVVVGAPTDGEPGKVYVFVKPQQGWENMMQTAILTPSDGIGGDLFGGSVSISGQTIVVGAVGSTVNGNHDQGAAYIFVQPPSGWSNANETAKLSAADGAEDLGFGSAVGVSGTTVAVGAEGGNANDPTVGTAYIFSEPPGGWATMTQTAELSASDASAYDEFGSSIAVDDGTVLVGAYEDGCTCNVGPGAGYLFVEPSSGWANMTETAKLTASDGKIGDLFGKSVSVSGNTAVVGAPRNDNGHGALYIFVEPTKGWSTMTQTAKLEVPKSAGVGNSVSISGEVLVTGSPLAPPMETGAAYVFLKPAGGWKDSSKPALTASVPFTYGYDFFGSSVGVSGESGVVGAYAAESFPPCEPVCQAGPGQAYLFLKK